LRQLKTSLLTGLLLFIFLISCVPLDQSSTPNFVPKKISYVDKVYDSSVGAIIIYNQNQTNPPIVELSSAEKITVEFDLFEDESNYINAKLIHCDSYWNKSRVQDLQILDEYNQFLVTNYQFSENTITGYIHYKMDLPKPKISGNYILAVYRDNNEEDLLFTRRFLITEKLISIEATVQIPRQVQKRNSAQDIQLNVLYENINTTNPQQEFTATIRQNFRWDQAKRNIKATNNLANEKKLEFRSFDNETTFDGGNEFRLIDLRSRSVPGMNVESIQRNNSGLKARSKVFKHYKGVVYSRPVNNDMNGRYFHSTIEVGADPLEVDYISTTFNIDLGQQLANKPLHLMGNFNLWAKTQENQLIYNDSSKLYECDLFLKQGVYNFTVEGGSSTEDRFPLDKTYRLTENEYDIIIYRKVIGTNYDRIVGYHSFSSGRN